MLPAKPFAAVSFSLLCAVFLCGAGIHPNAEELLTLKAQGDEEAAKEELTVKQDETFRGVISLIGSGKIRKGMKNGDVRKTAGDPVAVAETQDGSKWLYKARSKKKWLEVPRVWLYFDKKGVLTDWECAHIPCG